MTKTEERYREALAAMPAPGEGCHPALLGAATRAIMVGRSDEEALAEIRDAIPPGDRCVSDQEITDAILRAHLDTIIVAPGGAFRQPIPSPRRTVAEIRAGVLKKDGNAEKLRRAAIVAGGGELDPFGDEVRESSPIRIDAYSDAYPYAADMVSLLRNLYRPDDILFIGRRDVKARLGEDVRTAAKWITHFESCLAQIAEMSPESQQAGFAWLGENFPLIMPNPLTGGEGKTKDGKPSFRADSCVREYRYIVAEFDGMSFNEQGAILRGLCKAGAKIAAVIYSGNKSCHAWICCDGVTTAEEWETKVKRGLFPVLAALGVDRACSNPARMSRLPGVFRADKGDWQRLLYLAPEGGAL